MTTKPRLLLADDSPTILKIVSDRLREEGYEVITAADGVEAAEKAFRESPDLILLDVVMPRMNGYQVCRLLKNEPSTKHIPIAILTSKDQPREKFWGLQTGADEYICKGIDDQQLLEIIQRLLRRSSVVKPIHKNDQLRPLQHVDILQRANELLDRTLYDATIVNEIGKLVHSLQNYEETIQSTLVMLHKLIDYSVAVLALTHGEGGEFIVKPWLPFIGQDELTAIREKVLGILRPYLPFAQGEMDFPVRVLGGDGQLSSNQQAGLELEKMICVPVKAKGAVVGLFAVFPMPGKVFTPEDEDTLRLVANHAYIVIDNAWLYEEIRKLSMRDGLTRVYNRRYLDERLEEEFKKSMRYNKHLCVVMMDLDHFKKVNDRYGHQTGDMVLRRVTECCREAIRATDIIGRYGGEEFLIVLPDTDARGGMMVAERIRKMVEEAVILAENGERLRVTVSLGVCDIPRPGINTVEKLIEAVDQALYEAKRRGRNRVCAYTAEEEVASWIEPIGGVEMKKKANHS